MGSTLDRGSAAGRRRAGGCGSQLALAAAGLIGLGLVVAATMSAIAYRQTRGMLPRPQRVEHRPPVASPTAAGGVLQLRVLSARLVLTPAPAGEPIAVDAEFDPRYYELLQSEAQLDDGRWLYRVRFYPVGNHAMAILRMKLGTALPTVRVRLPRDVVLEIDGDVRAGFAALELGGTSVEGLDVFVAGGAGTISFVEPLAVPMGRFALAGDKGSLEVTGLGHASPAEVDIEHRLGELDLDLRGEWRRDASIRLSVSLAGGGVWLPTGPTIEGLPAPHERSPPPGADDELARPRLRFDVSEGAGRLVFID